MITSKTLNRRLDSGLEALSLDIDEAARHRLLDFVALLVKWNRIYNLTAIRDPEQMIARHLLDSLVLLPWVDESSADPASAVSGDGLAAAPTKEKEEDGPYDLLDIGSGGGLPVIPLAIARPDLTCLSVETNGKKTRFQQQVALELGLSNLEVRQARIENCAERARFVTSRAFTAPAEFLAVAARHATMDGCAIVMLGQAERLPDSLPEPWQLQLIKQFQVPELDAPRHLAICRMRNECSTLDT